MDAAPFLEITMTTITRTLILEEDRVMHTANLFGFHWALHLEPLAYAMADSLSSDYTGGYWDFFSLNNGGFHVTCENSFEGDLSADAVGITVCLYACSGLSFSGMLIADVCAGQYHLLREYALEHSEAAEIMAAVD
jgi:hypothetical protein